MQVRGGAAVGPGGVGDGVACWDDGWDVPLDAYAGGPPFEDEPDAVGWLEELDVDPFAVIAAAPGDPIDSAVERLRAVDRAMAGVLRDLAQAGPADGLPARRSIALRAGATGSDVGFLERAVEVLRSMQRVQCAFDAGVLSWSQVRGIVLEARRLSVAQREVLDEALAGVIGDGRSGEPDRVVEVAGDVAARLEAGSLEKTETDQAAEFLVLQPTLDGGGDVHGHLLADGFAAVTEAMDALADAPVAADAEPATDDDGRRLPAGAQRLRRPSRAAQHAEALVRAAAHVLGCGEVARARPRCTVIAPLRDLLPDAAGDAAPWATASRDLPDAGSDQGEGVQAARLRDEVTARLLHRRGSGRQRITRQLVRRLADDADLLALFTDEHGTAVAIGDSYAPITPAMRRAVTARDQGCRAPGCRTPMAHCDLHHVVPRERGGPTEVANLVGLCRPCHMALDRHGWQMRLDADGTLRTRIGRRWYTTRPRLTPDAGRPAP